MIKHTAHYTGFPHNYAIKDAAGELIATVSLAIKNDDAEIMRLNWYGGEKHGKTELVEGGLEGVMEYIGAAH